MTNSIVQTNVSQIIAPTPSSRQKTGALLSQGGTTTVPGTKTLLTAAADLTPVQSVPLAITSLAWSGSVVTATTAAPLGANFPNGTVFKGQIAGATPAGYNGKFNFTVTGASTFTYPLVANPGAETVPGTWVPQNAAELLAKATSFFAQGAGQAVYVLELGPGQVSAGVAYLAQWIADNDNFFYAYLVDREWDANADFLTLLASFQSTTAKTYFFITTTVGTYASYTALMKCAYTEIDSPDAPSTEFSLAADFHAVLSYAPSSTNRVTPLSFTFCFGVTPYPTVGNQALFTALKAAGVNWKGTGAEGGISDVIILWGTTMDVRPFNYWYAVDWAQINVNLAIANAVINGSNDPTNPLYFTQNGIDRLEQVGGSTLSSGVSFGIVLGRVVQASLDAAAFRQNLDAGLYAGQAVINAVPFVPYNRANPGDYKIGKYGGFSVAMTPLRGFDQIIFDIDVTDFVA